MSALPFSSCETTRKTSGSETTVNHQGHET